MKTIPIGNAVLCEHVVNGENNKHILINTYSGDIVVQALPANLTLGLYLEIIPAQNTSSTEIALDVVLGSKTVASISIVMQEVKKDMPSLIVIPQFNMGVEKDAVFKVTLSQAGSRKTTALSKKIYQGEIPVPSPTASPQQL